MPNCKETDNCGCPIPCGLPLCIGTQRFRSEVNHQILQIVSVTLFEKILLYQVLTESNYKYENVEVHNHLILFKL